MLPRPADPDMPDDYVTIAVAAEFLGVSPDTLRNWDESGRLKPRRHPINDYRLYRLSELESLPRTSPRRRRKTHPDG